MTKEEYIKEQAHLELARRELYYYCRLRDPEFYKKDRIYLKNICDDIQDFIYNSEEHFLIINVPPRHGKSYTSKNTVEWLLGKNPRLKVMTGSYNETLSTNFAKQIRDNISEIKVGKKIVYNDIFPKTKIKSGEAAAAIWALDGNPEKSYLATSPGGTATGFGANILIIDDIIKNAEEAYNQNVLDKHWEWFNNTMLQRLEGTNWKVIIIMTRWSTNDLAGRIIDNFSGVKVIKYIALQNNNTMLCDDILSYSDYLIKTKEMNIDIVEANYQQTPLDIKGKLYSEFKVWEQLPKFHKKYNYTDTADTGSDFLCSIDYIIYNDEAYITDIVFTNKSMEITENLVADMFYRDNVNNATIESNNGGRGFSRNVGSILKHKYRTNKTIIKSIPQTKNKISRILTSSSWVNNHIYMPFNWKNKYPEFYKHINSYLSKGKNAHDDGPDVLAAIYENITGKLKPKIYDKNSIGLGGNYIKKGSYWKS